MFPWKNHCKDGSLHLMQWNARGSAAKFFNWQHAAVPRPPTLTHIRKKDLESWKHLATACQPGGNGAFMSSDGMRWAKHIGTFLLEERHVVNRKFQRTQHKKTTIKHWLLHWSMSICGRRFEPLKTFDMKTGHWRPRRKSASVRGVMSLTVAAVVRLCLCLCCCGCGWDFGQVFF